MCSILSRVPLLIVVKKRYFLCDLGPLLPNLFLQSENADVEINVRAEAPVAPAPPALVPAATAPDNIFGKVKGRMFEEEVRTMKVQGHPSHIFCSQRKPELLSTHIVELMLLPFLVCCSP